MVADPRVDSLDNPEDWRVLRALAVYRLLLVGLLATLALSGAGTLLFEVSDSQRVQWIALAYGWPAAMLMAAALNRLPRLSVQAHLAFLTDTVAVIGLMYTARGAASGLGVLLITPAVGCSLVLPLRLGLLHAALGTFALFSAEAWHQSGSDFSAPDLTTSALLGLMLFATAIGAGVVAQRARRSEALAQRVGSDLENASRLNERIVESMDRPVLVLDEARRLRLLNAAARRLLPGRGGQDQPLDETLPALARALRLWEANPGRAAELLRLQADGPELTPSFTRLGYSAWAPVLVVLDDALRVREQAQQLKLAALGRLSAGIAHEIRNPLSAIRHAGQLLAETPELAAQDRHLLEIIQRHTRRIDKIVGDVLNLSRREAAMPQRLSLAQALERAIDSFVEGAPGSEAAFEPRAIPDELRVRFDASHLQQVLHNLWQNSFDHGARSGRAVRVRLSSGRLGASATPYLDIRDDGDGIAPEQREKLFEPFFTTAHHGTGLGLYLSRELCEYNQAQLIHVPTETGTCFRVIFAAG